MASKSKKNPHNNVALHTTNHRKSIMITSGNGTARSVKHDLAGCNFSDVGNTGCFGQFPCVWLSKQSTTHLLNSDVDTIWYYLHLFASIVVSCNVSCICLHQSASICLWPRNVILEQSTRDNFEANKIKGGEYRYPKSTQICGGPAKKQRHKFV